MRLYSAAALAGLLLFSGCSSDREQKAVEPKPTEDAFDETETAGRTDIPTITPRTRLSTPAPSPTVETPSAASSQLDKVSTGTSETTSPAAAAMDEEVIVAQPSRNPVLMARTVELRKKLQAVRPEAGALPKAQADELRTYATTIIRYSNESPDLTKDQRLNMEIMADKVQYQSTLVSEGQVQPPFDSRLQSIKQSMKSLQQLLAQ